MTNREALEARIGLNYPIEEQTFCVAVAEAGLDPNGKFTPGRSFDRALIAVIDTLIGSAERITEGGFTSQLDLEALLKLRSMIARKWDWPDTTGPYLTDRTYMW